MSSGDWEPATFAVLDHFLTARRVLVDVGAWIGPVTLYAASLGAEVIAFEPDPVARRDLLAGLDPNPALSGRVEVHEEAVGPEAGISRLGNITSAAGGDSMSSLLFGDSQVGWPARTVTQTEVLDAVDGLGLVKVDVEGSEVEILAAAADYLAEHQPALYLSVHAVLARAVAAARATG